MLFAETSYTEIGSVFVSVISGVVSLWVILRRQKSTERKQEVVLTNEETGNAITYWRDFARRQREAYERDAKERRDSYRSDLERLEKKIGDQSVDIAALRESEKRCQIESAVQRSEIAGLNDDLATAKEDLAQLRAALRNAGISTGTGEHHSLKPDVIQHEEEEG